MVSLKLVFEVFLVVLVLAHVACLFGRPTKQAWLLFDYIYFGVGALSLLAATSKMNDMIDSVQAFYPQRDLEWNYGRARHSAELGEKHWREYANSPDVAKEYQEKGLALSDFFHRALLAIDKGYKDGAWRHIPSEVGTDLDLSVNDMNDKITPKGDLPGADFDRTELLTKLKFVHDFELQVGEIEKQKESRAPNPESLADLWQIAATVILPWALSFVVAVRITKITCELLELRNVEMARS